MAHHVDASEYKAAAGKLRAAPAKLRRDFSRRLSAAARPVLRDVLREGAEALPSRGGLRAHIVSSGQVSVSRAGLGIRGLLLNKRVALGRINAGVLRHPLFGRPPWFSQSVPAGTFDAAFDRRAEELRREVARVFDDVADSL
jgi:hypothetical protein